MEYRMAVESDAPLLADINRQLIEDEWGGAGCRWRALEGRVRRWLQDDEYRAVLFQQGGETVA
jgi:hypothetical protein